MVKWSAECLQTIYKWYPGFINIDTKEFYTQFVLTKFIILYHTYQFIEIFTRDKTIFLKYKIQEQLPCLLVDSWGCLKENYKSYWWLWEEAIQLILNESRLFM